MVEEAYMGIIDTSPFLRTRYGPNNLLRHVRNIELTAPFHVLLEDRCVHTEQEMWEEDDEDENEYVSSCSKQLVPVLLPLLEGCKDDALRSFTLVFS
jgi:hypothetical protein